MVNANIDIFEMSYEESVSYIKRLDNLEKIRCSPGPATLTVDIMRSITSIVGIFLLSLGFQHVVSLFCQKQPQHGRLQSDCQAQTEEKGSL
jgi:hypothetical protein